MFWRIKNLLAARVALCLRLAGAVSICSGLVGGLVWLVDLEDRSDGDKLRWGFWHNPFMQFPPFNEPFLDLSIWVLLVCSAMAGLGGILLLIPVRPGIPLVTWQARISIVTNGVIVFFIIASLFVFAKHPWDEFYVGNSTYRALGLRIGSIVIDVMLWMFLSSGAVRNFRDWPTHQPVRGFDVVVNEQIRSN